MTPAERVKLSMTITLGQAIAFTEWTHSFQNHWIWEPGTSLWTNITGEESITTSQLFDLFVEQQNTKP
jgi:hypothetical protein